MKKYKLLLFDESKGNSKFKDKSGEFEATNFASQKDVYILFDSEDDYGVPKMGTIVDKKECKLITSI